MSAAIGAALAGARTMTATSSQGLALMAEVVYIAASMRAPIVVALGNRALSGPINIHCDHSDSMLDPRLRRDPALRRERAGGLRPDACSRRGSPSTRTSCCPCSSARTASRSRTPPSRSRSLADDEVARVRRRVPRSRTRCSTSRSPTTPGPVRDARLLLRAEAPAGRGDARPRSTCFAERRRRARAAHRPPLRPLEPYRLDDADARARRARLDRRARSRTSSTSCAPRASAVGLLRICSFRPFPARGDREPRSAASTPSSCSTAPSRRAARRRSTRTSPPRSRPGRASAGPRLRARRPRSPPGRLREAFDRGDRAGRYVGLQE